MKKKVNQVIRELESLNFALRGHKVTKRFSKDFPPEVEVSGIDIPMIMDCRVVAEKVGCEFKVDNLFNVGIFRF